MQLSSFTITLLIQALWTTTYAAAKSYHIQHHHTFLPLSGETGRSKEMLIFNITAVHNLDNINSARLYLHRRKIKPPEPSHTDTDLLPTPATVIIYQMQTSATAPRRLVSLPIAAAVDAGWSHIDLTSEIQEIHARSRFFAAQFFTPTGKKIALKHFLKALKRSSRRPSSAYLIITSTGSGKSRHQKHRELKFDRNEMSNTLHRHNEAQRDTKHEHKIKQSEGEHRQQKPLKFLPFLHVNEMADMQRRSRSKRFTDGQPPAGSRVFGEWWQKSLPVSLEENSEEMKMEMVVQQSEAC